MCVCVCDCDFLCGNRFDDDDDSINMHYCDNVVDHDVDDELMCMERIRKQMRALTLLADSAVSTRHRCSLWST